MRAYDDQGRPSPRSPPSRQRRTRLQLEPLSASPTVNHFPMPPPVDVGSRTSSPTLMGCNELRSASLPSLRSPGLASSSSVLRSPDAVLRQLSARMGKVRKTIDARGLFQKLVETRLATGEPYIVFSDTVNRMMPKHHRELGLKVSTSNLCAEITLPTGIDHLGNDRTAVCCLSSLNLEKWDEWSGDKQFIEDIMRFLDNVLQDYLDDYLGYAKEPDSTEAGNSGSDDFASEAVAPEPELVESPF